ncbi:protein JINGUBANG-like [Cornus florida]|uniref:protein JINGUBANG-like n=1 Tax=Cornus florida TaxID=4283 RepID=UPI00289B27AB|nr:protein JINGUBANG-like [Cornus florida]
MGLLPCPLPCHTNEEESDPRSQSESLQSDTSSNTSLYSQPSLPSVPSLTPPPQQNESTAAAANHHCLSTLKGPSYVFALSLAGKHLYTGYSNSDINVCSRDPSTLNHSTMVATGHSAVKSMVVLGDKLFSAHQDHKIRVWKVDNDTPNHRYKCLAVLPTFNDRAMRLFSAKNYVQVRRHKKCTWVHHVDTISALALSKDGSVLYSVSWDRTFKVWRTSDFKCLESVWNAHDDAINALVLSNDGFVYTGSADRKIKVWKKNEGEKKHELVDTLEKHKSAVNALALSNDGSVLYSGACDRSIMVWERDGGSGGGGGGHMVVAGALRGHTKAILCLAVVSDLVCSGSADKTVRVWKRGVGRSYSCLAVLEGHNGPVKSLTVAIDNKNSSGSGISYLVYSGSLDCDIKVWQIWVPF